MLNRLLIIVLVSVISISQHYLFRTISLLFILLIQPIIQRHADSIDVNKKNTHYFQTCVF